MNDEPILLKREVPSKKSPVLFFIALAVFIFSLLGFFYTRIQYQLIYQTPLLNKTVELSPQNSVFTFSVPHSFVIPGGYTLSLEMLDNPAVLAFKFNVKMSDGWDHEIFNENFANDTNNAGHYNKVYSNKPYQNPNFTLKIQVLETPLNINPPSTSENMLRQFSVVDVKEPSSDLVKLQIRIVPVFIPKNYWPREIFAGVVLFSGIVLLMLMFQVLPGRAREELIRFFKNKKSSLD